ncbi:MAG: DUF4202 domain-containing protein [Hyphomicrobiaceae bacterium]|nr:DUF4202 domain-containing protein [Hyphomicrobiaceae bacterium]
MSFLTSERYLAVIGKIDAANAKDPRRVEMNGEEMAFETVYTQNMMEVLQRLYPDAGELLHIAARAQHIERWSIPRDKYPTGREGYNKWRFELRALHARLVGEFMSEEGYAAEDIELIGQYLQKKKLKKEADSQALENVVDVVFLEFYWDDFAKKYSDYDDDKMIDIIGKTLRKMSSHGHAAALELDMSIEQKRLVLAAVDREKDRLAEMAKVEKF